MIQVDPQLLAIVGGIVVPLVVGFVTKLHATSAVKAIVNLALSAVTGAIATLTTNGGHIGNWKSFLVSIAVTFGTSIMSYYGFWKPTTVSTQIQNKTANFGIGSGVPTPDPTAANVVVNGNPVSAQDYHTSEFTKGDLSGTQKAQ